MSRGDLSIVDGGQGQADGPLGGIIAPAQGLLQVGGHPLFHAHRTPSKPAATDSVGSFHTAAANLQPPATSYPARPGQAPTQWDGPLWAPIPDAKHPCRSYRPSGLPGSQQG